MNGDSYKGTLQVDEADPLLGRLGTELSEPWDAPAGTWIARAPGRLDVLGGFAEYSGSLVLAYPLQRGVRVAVAPHNDETIRLYALPSEGNGSRHDCRWPTSMLLDAARSDAGRFAAVAGECGCQGAAGVAAAVFALSHAGHGSPVRGGAAIGIDCDFGGSGAAGQGSAAAVATLFALSSAYQLGLSADQVVELATNGLNRLWGRAQGIAECAAAVHAQPDQLVQIRCYDRQVVGHLPLPAGVALSGVDCGFRNATADEKYIEARTAAFMGTLLVGRMVGAAVPGWQGHLAQLSIHDYVERVRDRLPTRMKGADFVHRFGDCGDPLTQVDPSKTYKVRSRTEHHIYENVRARQFAERIARASRTGDRQAIIEAGELMFASHWSYGQRCGLGCIETDQLVTLLRREGVERGIYGARISDRGCGGTVVVLHADTAEAREAIRRAVGACASRNGSHSEILDGTSPGALLAGVKNVA